MRRFFTFFLVASFFITACRKDVEKSMVGDENVLIPNHIPLANYSAPLLHQKTWVDMGRKLFYDTNLSIDSSISCASCHAQVHGFADHGLALSQGFQGQLGTRNSPAIFNMAWNSSFMWDGGINHLEVMPVAPFTSEVEMNISMHDVVQRVNNNTEYAVFNAILQGESVYSDAHILKALAAFMSKITSFESRYDAMRQGILMFNETEVKGYRLFQEYCNTCHAEPMFTDYTFASNRNRWSELDPGRYRITMDSADYGLFKVPTLRNLSYTNPYRHDGSEHSLDVVLSNYLKAGEEYFSDDARIQHLYTLTSDDLQKIKSFLLTLDDPKLLSNQEISEP